MSMMRALQALANGVTSAFYLFLLALLALLTAFSISSYAYSKALAGRLCTPCLAHAPQHNLAQPSTLQYTKSTVMQTLADRRPLLMLSA
jgi:hypothetical protein